MVIGRVALTSVASAGSVLVRRRSNVSDPFCRAAGRLTSASDRAWFSEAMACAVTRPLLIRSVSAGARWSIAPSAWLVWLMNWSRVGVLASISEKSFVYAWSAGGKYWAVTFACVLLP